MRRWRSSLQGRICTGIASVVFSAGISSAQEKGEIITFTILHTPVTAARPGKELKIAATITEAKNVAYASVNYRHPGETSFKTIFMKNTSKDLFTAVIPASDVRSPRLEYYIFVMDIMGVPHVLFRDPKFPQGVAVAGEAAAPGAGTAGALEEEFALFAAENIVYAAAKREQKITEAPAAISVISDDEIKDSGAVELYDVMRKVPGVDVMSIDPSQTLVGARGFLTEANRYMLVLVDGMVINDEILGQAFWTMLPITIDDVKRIEVIRGPGSALYGANAYSGVTSIVTKSPKDAKGVHAYISRNTPLDRDILALYATARAGGEVGPFGYRVSANKTQANSWYDPQLRWQDTIRADAFLQYEDKGMKGSADIGYVNGDIWTFSTLGPILLPLTTPHVKLTYDYKSFKALAYWNASLVDISLDHVPGAPPEVHQALNRILPLRGRGNTYDVEVQNTSIPAEPLILTYGASFKDFTFDASILDRPHNEQITAGGFLQAEIRPVESAVLTLSGRGDWNNVLKEEWTFSPRATLIYSPVRDQTFRASWGIAFRKPAFIEYGMRIQFISPFLPLSNPDLVNEINRSAEFGYATRITDRVKLNIDLFYDQYRKFVEFVSQAHEYLNTGKDSDGYGGEINTDVYITKGISGFANYAYFRAVGVTGIDYSLSPKVDPDLAYPHHKANVGVRYKEAGLTINLWAHYVGSIVREIIDPNASNLLNNITVRQRVPEYLLLNANVGYRFTAQKTEIGISAFNLLNDRHREFPGIEWKYDSLYVTPRLKPTPENFGGQELGMRLMGYITMDF